MQTDLFPATPDTFVSPPRPSVPSYGAEVFHSALCGHCHSPLCPSCSRAAADDLRELWAERIRDDEPAIFARLSVASAPSLATAWSDLVRTRRRFGRRSWLTSTSSGWLRTTEVTIHSGLWHVHDNLLILGTAEQLQQVADEIATKWATAAVALGLDASPRAQYVEHAHSTGAVRHYMLKRLMGRSTSSTPGQTPGDLYAAMTEQGDADAAEHWDELVDFLSTRVPGNLTSRGGSLIQRRSDYDLAA